MVSFTVISSCEVGGSVWGSSDLIWIPFSFLNKKKSLSGVPQLCGRSRFLLRIVGRRLFAIVSWSDHHRGPFEGVIPSAPAEPNDTCDDTKR